MTDPADGAKGSKGMEIALRFLLGGTIVSLFALVGTVLKPPTFAGIFGSAPSGAIATLAIAARQRAGARHRGRRRRVARHGEPALVARVGAVRVVASVLRLAAPAG